jgi:hypothetical protein
MAENLCGNKEALVTSRGLTPEKPCGFWESEGWGWCNRKDYVDWLAKYKIIIDAAFAQMKELKKARKDKASDLTPEELTAEAEIQEHKNLFKALQEENNKDEGKLPSQEYSLRITKVIGFASDLLCKIEQIIQAGIEAVDVDLKPTGLIEGSRNQMGIGSKLGIGAGILTALVIYKRMK